MFMLRTSLASAWICCDVESCCSVFDCEFQNPGRTRPSFGLEPSQSVRTQTNFVRHRTGFGVKQDPIWQKSVCGPTPVSSAEFGDHSANSGKIGRPFGATSTGFRPVVANKRRHHDTRPVAESPHARPDSLVGPISGRARCRTARWETLGEVAPHGPCRPQT